MRYWVKSCGLMACLACLNFQETNASDAVVQDFDGWKITIQPGPTKIPSPAPGPAPAKAKDGPMIVPASYQQEVPPAPEGVAPPPAPMPNPVPMPMPGNPAADGLPIITPGESSLCCDTNPVVSAPDGTVDTRYLSQRYVEIYKSIPFMREYEANPSYIHDTAVEFTFGKMRPTTMVRGTINVNQNSPYGYGGYGVPYAYGGYGFGGYPNGFAYPPLQLVVPGTGLRIHRSY